MAKTFTYDADRIFIQFGDLILDLAGGYADGEFVTVKQDTADYIDKVGTDGTVTRSKTKDRRATIEIKLMQTSPNNALLSAMNLIDINTPNGFGIYRFVLTDLEGFVAFEAEHCWISKSPDISMNRETTERLWTLRAADLVRVGG